MTTCNQAIKQWEAKTESKAEDADHIVIYCQMPPIVKLDNSLNTLKACTKLSLSTNSIDRLIPLAGMKKLSILSIGRNQIKKIEKLEENADSLKEIWASYNLISTLDGLSTLQNLEILYLSNNKISAWSELDKLKDLHKLRDVLFVGNPIYDEFQAHVDERRIEVLKHIPQVQKIDGDMVKPSERDAAAES